MGWTELSKFDFRDRENVFLFYKRRHPIIWGLHIGLVLAIMVVVTLALMDPSLHPSYRARGAWLIALLLLLPLTVRALLCALVLGYALESIYQRTRLVYDKLPDIALGPSGIAQLDPWRPRAFGWQEIQHIRRFVTQGSLILRPRVIWLSFSAPRARPKWLQPWLWGLLPSHWIDRGIAITPKNFGLTEAELLKTVERFAGRIPMTEHDMTP